MTSRFDNHPDGAALRERMHRELLEFAARERLAEQIALLKAATERRDDSSPRP